jgi:hypothetical protein
MSLNSRCSCESCGNIYSLFSYETKLLPGMKIGRSGKIRSKEVLRTWTDWVEHLASFCPDCRYKIIPSECIKDYDTLYKSYVEKNQVEDE